jgi:hypothetical protein
VIYEIVVTVIADGEDEAHEAIAQLAESRGSEIAEISSTPIVIADIDAEDVPAYAMESRLTPGRTDG